VSTISNLADKTTVGILFKSKTMTRREENRT